VQPTCHAVYWIIKKSDQPSVHTAINLGKTCEFPGFGSGVVEIYFLLGCDATPLMLPTFWGNVVVSLSWTFSPLKMRQLCCLKMSGISYPITQPQRPWQETQHFMY
jgi:hypothetical protein